jgi:COP9 signalosome complex subunit 4
MDAALSEVGSLPSTSKTAAFTSLLDKTLDSQSSSDHDSGNLARDLEAFISAVVQDSVGLVVSKQVVALFVKRLNEIKGTDARRAVAERTLELLQDRQASFEEQVSSLVY